MALQQILKLSPAEEILFADKVLAERAIERGRIEGKLEGKLEGQQELLRKLLMQRFGELPAAVNARIQSATSAELEQMSIRVLTATTLREVVAKPKRKRA